MKNDLVDKLALIYVQAHTDSKTTPSQMYDLYKKAVQGIREAETQDMSVHMTVV